jgi:indole-3-glycerol phosphate synthase
MRIGLRYRRAGMIDRILIPKRASIARMLAGPLFPARRAPRPGVAEALRRPPGAPLRLVAELDLRPPGEDEIPPTLSPIERALGFARAGAAMISLPTDAPFAGGSFAQLAACRDALDAALGEARPALLCRDFVLHPIQLDRARDAGADAVLLIARIVEGPTLSTLYHEARARGLAPVIEVATPDELAAALALHAPLVAVSARDLNTSRVHPTRASALLEGLDRRVIALLLTGLDTPEAVREAAAGRADAALITDVLARPAADRALLGALAEAAAG